MRTGIEACLSPGRTGAAGSPGLNGNFRVRIVRLPYSSLVSDARRDEVFERVRAACVSGQQAYWVCPLIEESEVLQLQNAQETYQLLIDTSRIQMVDSCITS